MKKVFITGIDGFLGAALTRHLRPLGYNVIGNDNHLCHTGLTTLAHSLIDCRYFEAMRDLLEWQKPEVLVHCAATAHEGLSTFSPSFVTQNIFEASVATFSAAIAAGVKRIVFMSSMARYGKGPFGPPFSETMLPAPIDPYGIAKVAAERVLEVLCRTHAVAWTILVPHNIIGAGQKYDDPYRNVAAIMINRALQGLPIYIYGDGEQRRSFSPVNDILPCLESAICGAADGEVVNIGPNADTAITINRLAELVREITGSDAATLHVPARPNEVKNAYCTNYRSKTLLGYQQTQPLEECLTEMVDAIRSTGPKPFQHFAKVEIDSTSLPETWRP